jgi:hypothetical protein
MSEPENAAPVTWAHRLRVFMLAVVALAFVTAVVKVVQGEEPPLWWLYLAILVVLGLLAWIESAWAVFAFALYVVSYKFLPIFAVEESYLLKGIVAAGLILACGAYYLFLRWRRRGSARPAS